MSEIFGESQRGQQYSSLLRTRVLYRISIVSFDRVLNARRTHALILLASEVILPICLFQERLFESWCVVSVEIVTEGQFLQEMGFVERVVQHFKFVFVEAHVVQF